MLPYLEYFQHFELFQICRSSTLNIMSLVTAVAVHKVIVLMGQLWWAEHASVPSFTSYSLAVVLLKVYVE